MREQWLAKQRVAILRNDHILAFGEEFETLLTFWNSFNIRFVIFLTLCDTCCCTWLPKAIKLPRLLTVMHTCCLLVQRSLRCTQGVHCHVWCGIILATGFMIIIFLPTSMAIHGVGIYGLVHTFIDSNCYPDYKEQEVAHTFCFIY